MLGLSFGEILLLAVIGLVVIGPKQLPELARTLGRILNELKRSADGFFTEFKNIGVNEEYRKHISPPPLTETKIEKESDKVGPKSNT